MDVRFFGAVQEVTGSMHMIETGHDKVLLDAGMFQGRREESERKNRQLPFDPSLITNVVLSHAHIDHSGRIPLLTSAKFTGTVFATRTTAHACEYMLLDSAGIQESDAGYLNYKRAVDMMAGLTGKSREKAKQRLKKNNRKDDAAVTDFMARYDIKPVEPLYTTAHAEQALTQFSGKPYNQEFTIGRDMTCTFYEAGHILGSALSLIRAKENGKPVTLMYTGDLGRYDKPIIKNPAGNFPALHISHSETVEAGEQSAANESAGRHEAVKKETGSRGAARVDKKGRPGGYDVDLLILESTYGDRLHGPVRDMKPGLKNIITQTVERGGSLLIPSFAFGRTQELLYTIHELYQNRETPEIPVYVDSPLATRLTNVFGEHPEVYDQETHRVFLEKGKNPFMFPQLTFVASVEDSMALMREKKPHIVISASGMCEAGRILHHLRYKIHNPKNTILFVGYMAEHTLGRRILERGSEFQQSGRAGEAPVVRFLGKEYPLKARVESLDGFSAHADKKEMLKFLRETNLKIRKIALVHGEKGQMSSFADTLRQEGYQVIIPKFGETVRV